MLIIIIVIILVFVTQKIVFDNSVLTIDGASALIKYPISIITQEWFLVCSAILRDATN